MVEILLNRCFQIRCNWSIFHSKLTLLEEIRYRKNSYSGNFINRCIKLFLNRIHILKEKVTIVEKRPLRLVLPFFQELYQCKLGLNCKKSPSKKYLAIANYRLLLKVKIKLCYDFHFRDPVILTSSVVYAMNPIMENVLDTSL